MGMVFCIFENRNEGAPKSVIHPIILVSVRRRPRKLRRTHHCRNIACSLASGRRLAEVLAVADFCLDDFVTLLWLG